MAKRSSEGESLERVKQIGRLSYSRKNRLGTGSFGSVFKGKYQEPGKPEIEIAIKRIENLDVNEIEKVVMEKLEPHPNVLQYYCTEEDGDFVYMATEVCAATLDDIIKGTYQGPLAGSTREMMLQIARGLEHLHKNNIVHRDIKPANILVSFPNPDTNEPPKMKLADFGLCRVVMNDGTDNYLTKCGSKGWLAPELCSKALPITDKKAMFAVDIFSLGCVFAYASSKGNQHPFGIRHLRDYRIESEVDLILNPEDFDESGGQILFTMIVRMLSRNPDQRLTIEEVTRHPFFLEVANNKECCYRIDAAYYEALISSLSNLDVSNHGIDSNGRTPLMLLCFKTGNNDGIILRDYIEHFLNIPNVDETVVNTQDNDGNTALTILCEHYNPDDLIDIISLLIEKGANVNAVSYKNGLNALMFLCKHYHKDALVDIARLFIKNGVDLNTRTKDDNWNVLHILCRYYNNRTNDKLVEIITLLIKNGINLNAVTTKKSWNAMAFLFTYYTGDCMLHIIRLFIDNGMNVITNDENGGFNPLLFACFNYTRDDLIDIIKLLIEKDPSSIHFTNTVGKNCLIMLCQNAHSRSGLIDIIRFLINSGVDVNAKTKCGWNALMAVIRYYRHSNLMDIVQLLVDHGSEINCRNIYGPNSFTFLCTSEFLDHNTCLDLFRLFVIDLKADVSAVYEADGDNALINLCKYHNNCDKLVDIIRLILDNSNLDVNYKNKKGEDVMFTLKSKGRLLIKRWELILQLLIERGAC